MLHQEKKKGTLNGKHHMFIEFLNVILRVENANHKILNIQEDKKYLNHTSRPARVSNTVPSPPAVSHF